MFAAMDEARGLLRRCAKECGASTPRVLQGKDGYLAAHALAVSGHSDKETLLKQFRDSLQKVCCTRCFGSRINAVRIYRVLAQPAFASAQCSVVVRHTGVRGGHLLSSATLCPQHPALLCKS